jgi:Fe-S oxidoreductase
MSLAFAPGCALLLHKPDLARRLLEHLEATQGGIPEHLTCCHHDPQLPAGTRIINVCPGCDRRYRELYPGITTVSLWEVLAGDTRFPFPDYGGAEMAVLDACPTRTETRVHDAVRALLARMNIAVVEPERTRTRGACCGDSFYPTLPVAEVKDRMIRRAGEMPRQDVVVYCVSCAKAMHVGGRRPRYLVDLLFGEDTPAGVCEPDAWHRLVDEFIEAH